MALKCGCGFIKTIICGRGGGRGWSVVASVLGSGFDLLVLCSIFRRAIFALLLVASPLAHAAPASPAASPSTGAGRGFVFAGFLFADGRGGGFRRGVLLRLRLTPTPAFSALLVSRKVGALKLFAIFLLFQEIGDVKEGVAFKANIDEGRLHSGKHPGYAALVDGPCQGVFVFAFVVDFGELVVFENRQPRLVRGGGNANFF
jgi:hypothetical protein